MRHAPEVPSTNDSAETWQTDRAASLSSSHRPPVSSDNGRVTRLAGTHPLHPTGFVVCRQSPAASVGLVQRLEGRGVRQILRPRGRTLVADEVQT